MSLNLNTLVDPTASSQGQPSGTEATREPQTPSSLRATNTEYEAADALTTLANLGSAASYAPVHHEQAQSGSFQDTRQSNIHTSIETASLLQSPTDPSQNQHTTSSKEQRPPPLGLKIEGGILGQDTAISPSDIKQEPSVTPRAFTPSVTVQNVATGDEKPLDVDTLRTVAELKNEHGLRAHRETTSSTAPEVSKPTSAPVVPTKRRAAPKSTGGPGKKGQSAKKPPSKRRKLEVDTASANGVLNDRRSGTPSSRTSKTPGLVGKGSKKSQSGTPVAGSSPAPADVAGSSEVDESDSDDNTLYCVCRGKDDHTWMIGCESCDDWFHGRCVNLKKEDHEALLAKFICPNCEKAGHGQTTWKPMCRREGCNRPATTYSESKVVDGKKIDVLTRSKYCSNECGVKFFKNVIAAARGTVAAEGSASKRRGTAKRKSNTTETKDTQMDFSDDEYEPPPRGGVLRARDLKSLVGASENIEAFHHLGSGFLSPPASASPINRNAQEGDQAVQGDPEALPYPLTDSESERLSQLSTAKSQLRGRQSLLRDRERFVAMARESANKYAEKEGIKPKDVCGYDARLAWSESEFQAWRSSKIGRASLAANTFEPTEDDISKIEAEEDTVMTDGVASDAVMDKEALQATRSQPCTRKRCDRHKAWEKLHLHDLRFEEVEIVQALRKCESEEKDIRERAMLRWRKEKAMEGLNSHDMDSRRRGEGWVEVAG